MTEQVKPQGQGQDRLQIETLDINDQNQNQQQYQMGYGQNGQMYNQQQQFQQQQPYQQYPQQQFQQPQGVILVPQFAVQVQQVPPRLTGAIQLIDKFKNYVRCFEQVLLVFLCLNFVGIVVSFIFGRNGQGITSIFTLIVLVVWYFCCKKGHQAIYTCQFELLQECAKYGKMTVAAEFLSMVVSVIVALTFEDEYKDDDEDHHKRNQNLQVVFTVLIYVLVMYCQYVYYVQNPQKIYNLIQELDREFPAGSQYTIGKLVRNMYPNRG